MPNIKFNYLYRDAGNYKIHSSIIFNNPENLSLSSIEIEIKKSLIDEEFFNPIKFRVPKLINDEFDFDFGLDHNWNEFCSVNETEELPNDNRSIKEFIIEISQTNLNLDSTSKSSLYPS